MLHLFPLLAMSFVLSKVDFLHGSKWRVAKWKYFSLVCKLLKAVLISSGFFWTPSLGTAQNFNSAICQMWWNIKQSNRNTCKTHVLKKDPHVQKTPLIVLIHLLCKSKWNLHFSIYFCCAIIFKSDGNKLINIKNFNKAVHWTWHTLLI